MVLSESMSLLMLACHSGILVLNWSIHPSMLMSMSPVVEVSWKSGMVSLSPFPSMEEDSERVLLNVLSDGRKHAKSESVITDGLIFPR